MYFMGPSPQELFFMFLSGPLPRWREAEAVFTVIVLCLAHRNSDGGLLDYGSDKVMGTYIHCLCIWARRAHFTWQTKAQIPKSALVGCYWAAQTAMKFYFIVFYWGGCPLVEGNGRPLIEFTYSFTCTRLRLEGLKRTQKIKLLETWKACGMELKEIQGTIPLSQT